MEPKPGPERERQGAKVPNVAQVTEGRKCSKEAEAVGTRRGRQRRQSNIH